MTLDVSSIAYALRTRSAGTSSPLSLGHAQQCVAAALGFRTLASLQAAVLGPFRYQTRHLLIDTASLEYRRRELGLSLEQQALVQLVAGAMAERLRGVFVHTTESSLDESIQDLVDQTALTHRKVATQLAIPNHSGIDEANLEIYDYDRASVAVGGRSEFEVVGRVSVALDFDRPSWGREVVVCATLLLSRDCRALWSAQCDIESAELENPFHYDPDPRSIQEALAEEIGIEYDDAAPLVEASIREVSANGRGLAWEIDFESGVGVPAVAKDAIVRKFGSMRAHFPFTFFESFGADGPAPRRHFLHGDHTDSVSGTYFCSSCAAHMERTHFESAHAGRGLRTYQESLARREKRPVRVVRQAYRPARAANIFDHAAATRP